MTGLLQIIILTVDGTTQTATKIGKLDQDHIKKLDVGFMTIQKVADLVMDVGICT